MLSIKRFAIEGITEGAVIDTLKPSFTYYAESDREGVTIRQASLTVNGWTTDTVAETGTTYAGPDFEPYRTYEARLAITDDAGETAIAELHFDTGRLQDSWKARWITKGDYSFTEKGVSPKPMCFKKVFGRKGQVKKATVYATALGIYELTLNGSKVGNRYFAPGFTSYRNNLQYQVYDITDALQDNNELLVDVAGGWAVGSFVFTRKNRVYAPRQALMLEVRIEYADGATEIVETDDSWMVSNHTSYVMADLYDGETYDATITADGWTQASIEKVSIRPSLEADYGSPVVRHEYMKPVSSKKIGDATIYDFGQNFAGVIDLKIKGASAGQKVEVKHAEILNADGTLNTSFLRTAKATATYICRAGDQEYSPRFSYMGFRYAAVSGIDENQIEVGAWALYSDIDMIGSFECSDASINRLQQNIQWSSRSNFVDIPTDCPQRDERMGWTGDINVFAPTACFNFRLNRFLNKWMKDLRAEQLPTGGIPNTIPLHGYGFPATMPKMAVDWWDDACVMVPWAIYEATGDVRVLEENYESMKKYVKACKGWAGLLSLGKNRYIWNTPATLHFGDWVAPDVPKMQQWQARAKWTATASLRNTSHYVAKIADILGHKDEAAKYEELSAKVADAYVSVFTDGAGKLNEEFQTGYVLPIHLDMFPDKKTKQQATANLAELVKRGDYKIGTGFPGTPYILFALADNGYADVAFKMLMNKKCPSWLYEVEQGATTIWERWDGLDENGQCPISDDGTDMMISYNHYASGAVGAFLYKRVAGIEPVTPGYKTFAVKPLVGGGLTEAKASMESPYGPISSEWKRQGDEFELKVTVPVNTSCQVTLPDGSSASAVSGTHTFTCKIN